MRSHAHVGTAAIAMICAATLCFATLDSMMKYLSTRYPLSLILAVRWLIQAGALAAWFVPRSGTAVLRTTRLGAHLVRGVFLMLASLFFMAAIRDLPLADATAIHYTTPMIVAVMAVFVLGERMTVTRALFVVAGAAGMVLIVKPGSALFQGSALLVLVSAACYSTYQILTRRMADESPAALVVYPSLVCAAVFGLAAPFFVDGSLAIPVAHLAMLAAVALLGTLGHFLFVLAFRLADASALTPYTYSQLVWATIVGWIAFSDLPDGYSVAGMAIIAAGGLAFALVERRRSRTLLAAAPVGD